MTQSTQAIQALRFLQSFMPSSQLLVLTEAIQGEEKDHFEVLLIELMERIQGMPKTYETDGLGLEAVAYLHYFANGADFYITEKDMEPDQVQAFGLADLGQGGELGYISITELQANGIELDLYWTPKLLKEIQ